LRDVRMKEGELKALLKELGLNKYGCKELNE